MLDRKSGLKGGEKHEEKKQETQCCGTCWKHGVYFVYFRRDCTSRGSRK